MVLKLKVPREAKKNIQTSIHIKALLFKLTRALKILKNPKRKTRKRKNRRRKRRRKSKRKIRKIRMTKKRVK